jgi:uncharacterized membrane protein (TIGR02234 family)
VTPARRLTVTLLALALAALGLWVSTRLVWLRMTYQSPLRGAVTTQATGADVRPELAAVALLAVAAVAALVATGGWPRRVLGVVLLVAGAWAAWAAWQSVSMFGGSSVGWFAYAPPTPAPSADAVPAGPPTLTAAPLLALGAALVLVAAGVVVVCWAGAMPRLGGRYSAPGAAARTRDRDTEWWEAMDAGEDPTLKGPGADPGSPR